MLAEVTAIEFIGPIKRGITSPAQLLCRDGEGSIFEVVTKHSAGCSTYSLAKEVIAAQLASDLGLPVPRAFIAFISEAFIESIPDEFYRSQFAKSSRFAFGSRLMTPQFSDWTPDFRLAPEAQHVAFNAFLFDGVIQNPDRITSNPNCLIRSNDFVLIDHEKAFSHLEQIRGIPWIEPWQNSGQDFLKAPHRHIFLSMLRRVKFEANSARMSWASISDAKIASYGLSVPKDWIEASVTYAEKIKCILSLIQSARGQIDGCLAEAIRVLK